MRRYGSLININPSAIKQPGFSPCTILRLDAKIISRTNHDGYAEKTLIFCTTCKLLASFQNFLSLPCFSMLSRKNWVKKCKKTWISRVMESATKLQIKCHISVCLKKV